MKLSYPVATPDVRSAILGAKGRASEILPALRDLGYTAIEPFIGDPEGFDQDAWIADLRASGLVVAAVGTGPVVFDHKLTFTDPNPEVRHAAIERAIAVVHFSSRLGAQVNIGKLRGDLLPGKEENCQDWMREAFIQVCARAADLGIAVTLEPQNRTVINNLNTSSEALVWLDSLALPNLHLMLDVFHMHHVGEDLTAGFVASHSHLLHVHYADTERRVPGDGALDFSILTDQLRSLNYDRYVTVEVKQTPDSLTAAGRAAAFLLPLLNTP